MNDLFLCMSVNDIAHHYKLFTKEKEYVYACMFNHLFILKKTLLTTMIVVGDLKNVKNCRFLPYRTKNVIPVKIMRLKDMKLVHAYKDPECYIPLHFNITKEIITYKTLEQAFCQEYIAPPIHYSGWWFLWHENGALSEIGKYKDGYHDDMWYYYHNNSNKKAAGRFQEGLRVGIWEEYDRDEKLIAKGIYKNGIKVGIWEYGNMGNANTIMI